MPRRDDIEKILLIGSGPIVIGQACEFDYSGTQAVKVLRTEGFRVVLVNSNPATIMTDPEFADGTYIEPITPEVVAAIIRKEQPDALLPTLGGQTALNVTTRLAKAGVLDDLGVEIIGAGLDAIEAAEDRGRFKAIMDSIGIATARISTPRWTPPTSSGIPSWCDRRSFSGGAEPGWHATRSSCTTSSRSDLTLRRSARS